VRGFETAGENSGNIKEEKIQVLGKNVKLMDRHKKPWKGSILKQENEEKTKNVGCT